MVPLKFLMARYQVVIQIIKGGTVIVCIQALYAPKIFPGYSHEQTNLQYLLYYKALRILPGSSVFAETVGLRMLCCIRLYLMLLGEGAPDVVHFGGKFCE